MTLSLRRQYWGVLLLIFEWGTTWPFWMPEGVPVDQIPFKDDIGKVVKVSLEPSLSLSEPQSAKASFNHQINTLRYQTLVLPTIFANYQKAREAEQKKPGAPPSENAPTDAKEA